MQYNCQECGMKVTAGEYHPAIYCVLVKAGYDPHEVFEDAVSRAKAMLEEERGYPLTVIPTGTLDRIKLQEVQAFVRRVNARAEQNMETTGKLEGAHYAAMQYELAAMEDRS